VRVLADGQTHTQTDRPTDANRFYNLSHAICYSYGSDKKYLDVLNRAGVAHECDRRTNGQITVSNSNSSLLRAKKNYRSLN